MPRLLGVLAYLLYVPDTLACAHIVTASAGISSNQVQSDHIG
jgi:hypothetical protein